MYFRSPGKSAGEHELVHAGAVVGQRVHSLEPTKQIVGIEHRVLTGLAQAGSSEHANVGVRLDAHAKVPIERLHAAN